MDTNDYFRRIRYALQLDDAEAMRLIGLGGHTVSIEDMATWRTKEGETDFQLCPNDVIHSLLNGLILDRRGPPPESAGKPIKGLEILDNNMVLKQLRIALSMRADDVYDTIVLGGGRLGKTEVSALFRKTDARNYRRCGDQVVRWFLAGLAKQRDSDDN